MRDIFTHADTHLDGSTKNTTHHRQQAIRHWRKWVRSERDEKRKAAILHAISAMVNGEGEWDGYTFSIHTEFGSFGVNARGTKFSVRWK